MKWLKNTSGTVRQGKVRLFYMTHQFYYIVASLVLIALSFTNCGDGFYADNDLLSGQEFRSESQAQKSAITVMGFDQEGRPIEQELHYQKVGNYLVIDGDIYVETGADFNSDSDIVYNIALPKEIRQKISNEGLIPENVKDVLNKYDKEIPMVLKTLNADHFSSEETLAFHNFINQELLQINTKLTEIEAGVQLKLYDQNPLNQHFIEIIQRRENTFPELVKKVFSQINNKDTLMFADSLDDTEKKALLRQMIMQSLGFNYKHLNKNRDQYLLVKPENSVDPLVVKNRYEYVFDVAEDDLQSVLQMPSFTWSQSGNESADRSQAVFLAKEGLSLIPLNSEFSEGDYRLLHAYFKGGGGSSVIEPENPSNMNPVEPVVIKYAKKYSDSAGEIRWEPPVNMDYKKILLKWGEKGKLLDNTVEFLNKEKSFYTDKFTYNKEVQVRIYVVDLEDKISNPAVVNMPARHGDAQVTQAENFKPDDDDPTRREFKFNFQLKGNTMELSWGTFPGARHYALYDKNDNFIKSYNHIFEHTIFNLLPGDYQFTLVVEDENYRELSRLTSSVVSVENVDQSENIGLVSPKMRIHSDLKDRVFIVYNQVPAAEKYVYFYKPVNASTFQYGGELRKVDYNGYLLFHKHKNVAMDVYILSQNGQGKRSEPKDVIKIGIYDQGPEYVAGGCNVGMVKLSNRCVPQLKGVYAKRLGCEKISNIRSQIEVLYYATSKYMNKFIYTFHNDSCDYNGLFSIDTLGFKVEQEGPYEDIAHKVTLTPNMFLRRLTSNSNSHCGLKFWKAGDNRDVKDTYCGSRYKEEKQLHLAESGLFYTSKERAPSDTNHNIFPTSLDKSDKGAYSQIRQCPVRFGKGLLMTNGQCAAYHCNIGYKILGRRCVKKEP